VGAASVALTTRKPLKKNAIVIFFSLAEYIWNRYLGSFNTS
jgi:hypothetical protein